MMTKKVLIITLFSAIFSLFSCGIGEKETMKRFYKKMCGNQQEERLAPQIIHLPQGISDLSGINLQNSCAILTSTGEFGVLSFTDNMEPHIEVSVPGFPGCGGKLKTDPEYRFVWLHKNNENYYIDLETGQTGHSVSMFMESKVYQVILADPDNKVWYTVYGQNAYHLVDKFNLLTGETRELENAVMGDLYNFGKNRLLSYTKEFSEDANYESLFCDYELDNWSSDKENELLTQMNSFGIELDNKSISYSPNSRTMIGYTRDRSIASIRWNDAEDTVKIFLFSKFQIPEKLHDIYNFGEFSTDGLWFDMEGEYRTNSIKNAMEQIVYHVDDQYPGGISPPIYLGIKSQKNFPESGAFIDHKILGPCYLSLDPDDDRNILVYKLNDSFAIIDKQLKNFTQKVNVVVK